MSFSGFSEDDIRKINKTQDINKVQKDPTKVATKKVTFKNNVSSHVKNKSRPKVSNINNGPVIEDIPEGASLCTPKSHEDAALTNVGPGSITNPVREQNTELKPSTAADDQKKVLDSDPPRVEVEQKRVIDLSEFEARQKLIEEQNRKRKELLSKALADRTKRTQEEAKRLNEIQEEFKKLDAILSDDVKILRKQIELASVDYMECQKKYHKVEKEFLEAKMLLHQRQEKKEMLTEHLCAIIEKNEERKAQKLTELLNKLQFGSENNEKQETDSSVVESTAQPTQKNS